MALVAPLRILTIDVSTPCLANVSRIIRPSASSPTVPTNAADIPSAAAPAVEVPAGPPPRMRCSSIRTFVSIGMNGRIARWSFETNPTPMNSALFISSYSTTNPHVPVKGPLRRNEKF